MNDVILLLSAFGVMGYLVGIGKIIGNAIKIGFNSAHNNSNRTTAIYFYANVIILSNVATILYLVFTEELPLAGPESLMKGLPVAIVSCIALVVLHSITSYFAKLHYKQNINNMEEKVK
ncbi:hypothetical protein [Bacillus cabrialesii]